MVTSDFSPDVEIRPFRACAMHPAITIGTVRSLWTWLWGRYHVPQNAFLVANNSSYGKNRLFIFGSCAVTPVQQHKATTTCQWRLWRVGDIQGGNSVASRAFRRGGANCLLPPPPQKCAHSAGRPFQLQLPDP